MGKFKDRLTITFAANLVSWRLRENGGVEGIIAKSIDRDYKDGDKYLFKNTTLEHWPQAEGHWKDHFVMRTPTGTYFQLNDSDKFKGMGDASVE